MASTVGSDCGRRNSRSRRARVVMVKSSWLRHRGRYDWYAVEERAWVRPASEEDLELFSSLRGRRHPEGMFIGDGDKVVRRMLATTKVQRILCTEDWIERLPIPTGVEVRVAPKADLFAIVGFRLHQGLMALGAIPPEKPPEGTFHVALDG